MIHRKIEKGFAWPDRGGCHILMLLKCRRHCVRLLLMDLVFWWTELHVICFWWGDSDTLDVETTRESMYHGFHFRRLWVSLKIMLEPRFSNQDCLLFRHCSETTVIVEIDPPSHSIILSLSAACFVLSISCVCVCVCVLLWDDVQMRCTLRNWRVKPSARSWIWL